MAGNSRGQRCRIIRFLGAAQGNKGIPLPRRQRVRAPRFSSMQLQREGIFFSFFFFFRVKNACIYLYCNKKYCPVFPENVIQCQRAVNHCRPVTAAQLGSVNKNPDRTVCCIFYSHEIKHIFFSCLLKSKTIILYEMLYTGHVLHCNIRNIIASTRGTILKLIFTQWGFFLIIIC